MKRYGVLAAALWLLCTPAFAAEVLVAVAANFSAPMKQLAAGFEQHTGHKVTLAFGATGQFHAQIRHGAPFAVLLAADERTPRQLEQEGLVVPGTRFTYAEGRLVLWSATPLLVDEQGQLLKTLGPRERIAVADPRLAPYGAAAVQTLQALGLYQSRRSQLVQASSIAQAHQFVASGNALLGFVALSQVSEDGRLRGGSGWRVPTSLHAPIRQDAALLRSGRDNPAAKALLNYLQTEEAKTVIRAYGYSL